MYMVWCSSMHSWHWLAMNLMKSTGIIWPLNSTTCGKQSTIEKCLWGGGGGGDHPGVH